MSINRLQFLLKHLHPPSQSRSFVIAATKGKMDINTKIKMHSGYEIPALGYGVSLLSYRHEPAPEIIGMPI